MTSVEDYTRPPVKLTRKEMLKLSLFGAAALALPLERAAQTKSLAKRIPTSQLPEPFRVAFDVPRVLKPTCKTASADKYLMRMMERPAQILPGFPKTRIWGYNGMSPGPTILARHGRDVVVRHENHLPGNEHGHPKGVTSVHLHGNASLPQYDGYASDVIKPGFYKDYIYPNEQDARTLWYHDHGVHETAFNAYMGLAGMYITHDDLERQLPIPKGYYDKRGGRYDVPLVIRDALFSKDGQLIFDHDEHGSIFGDVILVNGRPWPLMRVEPRKYRFRVLNASLSRSYELALKAKGGSGLAGALTVIGTDGGLMPHPARGVESLRLGMAERYEVVIDFAQIKKNGARIVDLVNFSLKNNRDEPSTEKVMRFEIGDTVVDTGNNSVPEDLNPHNEVMLLEEDQALKVSRDRRPRVFDLDRKHGYWTVNGTIWKDVEKSGFTHVEANPSLGDIEVWTLRNRHGGWFHPLHIHLVDYKILDRNGDPSKVLPYERGPKDTVYLGENETIRVLMQFNKQGKYMIHCHNLVHEDHDMMTQFEVGKGGPDPMNTAKAQKLPAKEPLC